MRTELFDYVLPEARIAQHPLEARDGARLCRLERGGPEEGHMRDFPELLEPRDLLVLNHTRVRPARVYCRRALRHGLGGGQVEVLFLRPLGEGLWETLMRAGGRLGPGERLEWPEAELELTVLDKLDGGVLKVQANGDVEAALDRSGEMPLPPYMKRRAEALDRERYQTVFARELGSAAAPTAGLHLTQAMLERIEARGTAVGSVVLHVGLGTFRPVSSADLNDHPMHEEWYSVGEDLVAQVAATRARGGRVVAVGTTVVRALESASASGRLVPGSGVTRLLIQPGYRFNVVDALLTNFHQPRSTLLALVSAFAGRERVLSAYEWALTREFRFLSYGDAMWLGERVEP